MSFIYNLPTLYTLLLIKRVKWLVQIGIKENDFNITCRFSQLYIRVNLQHSIGIEWETDYGFTVSCMRIDLRFSNTSIYTGYIYITWRVSFIVHELLSFLYSVYFESRALKKTLWHLAVTKFRSMLYNIPL